MKYIVLEQLSDERVFKIRCIQTGDIYNVDLYTDGKFPPPRGADKTDESWRNWLNKKFIGKKIEIEFLSPYIYFSTGKQKIIT